VALPVGYDLLEKISETQSAQVWLARNPSGKTIVLKVAASVPQVQARFKRELLAMLKYSDFHVMPIVDHDAAYLWYAMPQAARTLYDVAVPWSLADCVEVIEAVAKGLKGLHAENQVHRDVKPQNILWLGGDGGGKWVIADFGIVRNTLGLTTHQLTQAGGLTGSAGWAAPEQYNDAHEATIAADVFSLGAVASWMLTGQQPSFGHVAMPNDARLGAVLRKATRPNAAERYESLDDFVRALVGVMKPATGTVDSLAQSEEWANLGIHILGLDSQRSRLVRDLLRIPEAVLNKWTKADGAGLADAVSALMPGVPEMSYREMDDFLGWCLAVIRAMVGAHQFKLAERVGVDLFAMTAHVNQFAPARAILDWLAVLAPRPSDVMERALHSSETWDFFQAMARDRFEHYTDTELITKLRQG
jgi:serine/threonine protein kinase